MEITSQDFKAVSSAKLKDEKLQKALFQAKDGFVVSRAKVVKELDNFEAIRQAASDVRDHCLAHLDEYLEAWESRAQAAGTIVHWAESYEELNAIVVKIAQDNRVKKIIKSKSMVGEETGLNEYVEGHGIEVKETDLGEYIIQQAGEHPSHIIAPATHKSKEDVSELFAKKHDRPRLEDAEKLTHEAREILRPHFLDADMGITGANFMIAETGSTVIVTNEGNGRMTTTMPRVHVAISSIEKCIPTLDDFALMMRLLPRSATGQVISNYVSMTTGPKRDEDLDGPGEFHVIILDVGRTRVLGSELREALRCIRCGACMNHCPVYQNVGGHAYGWVYPGPIGSVLTPAYNGLENAIDLPNAATLCNQCGVVCPVKIPLPDLMRKLREKQYEKNLKSKTEKWSLKVWAYVATRPKIYSMVTRVMARAGKIVGGNSGRIRKMIFAGQDWTKHRDLPSPRGRTFRDIYLNSKKINKG